MNIYASAAPICFCSEGINMCVVNLELTSYLIETQYNIAVGQCFSIIFYYAPLFSS